MRADRPKRLSRAVREQQMLDAAVAVFAERGYHEASMDEIAARADISKPMVYLYLGSKEELFAACAEREFGRVLSALSESVDSALPPDEQLWRGLHAFFQIVADHRDGWNVLHKQALHASGPVGERAVELRQETIDVVRGLLTLAMQAGRRRKYDEDELTICAHALVGAAESVADWMADRPDVTAKVASRRLMTICWVGLGEIMNGVVWRPTRSGA